MASELTPPAPVCVPQVLVLPYYRAWEGGPDPEAVPLHARMRQGRGLKLLDSFPENARAAGGEPLAGDWLWGGPYYKHFGHVMVDSVHRLWAFDGGRHEGVVFANLRWNKEPHPAAYFRQILSAFGVRKDRIQVLDAPAVVERLWCAEPGAIPEAAPQDWYWPWLAKVETTLLERASPELQTHDRLFLGRAHIRRKGSFMGESWFAQALEASGFHYLRPEELTVPDQVKLFRSAREVVFTEGSAAHVAEAMTPYPTRATMLARRDGGETIFAPHLAPRGRFEVAGRDSDIRRLPTAEGGEGPSAPSYHLRPERTHADLARLGLVDPRFDMSAFRAAERADAFDYFAHAPQVAEAQLGAIAALRATASALDA